jgi:6-phosphofructokinase 1
MRGIAKSCYKHYGTNDITFIGIERGYYGLVNGLAHEMAPEDFSGILTRGGTILGSKRMPFKKMQIIEEDNVDKVSSMLKTIDDLKLDALFILGGNGTHKTAGLLAEKGVPVIGLPKTIDNDLYGTDVTFGFHSAFNMATNVVSALHTTAESHNRIMVCEIMGNKAGWLTLYSGIAGSADIILLPEIPYDINKVCKAIDKRMKEKKYFSIIAVAEGTITVEESKMSKKELKKLRTEQTGTSGDRLANLIQEMTGLETRACIPGHMLRGGEPCPYDRYLSTAFGSYAAELLVEKNFGKTVAIKGNKITANNISDIAGIKKVVPMDDPALLTARNMGISLGI